MGTTDGSSGGEAAEPNKAMSTRRRVSNLPPITVPEDLIKDPPEWARSLIERGVTFDEFVYSVGEAARRNESEADLQILFRVVEQLACTSQGRYALDSKLTSAFVSWLWSSDSRQRSSYRISPAIIVYDPPDLAWPSAWLNPWEGETIWRTHDLQKAGLYNNISAVWQNHTVPFVELFLFDANYLQGSFVRIARVSGPIPQSKIVLDDATLNNRVRSLLASVHTGSERRFGATQALADVVTQRFAQDSSAPFGTVSLLGPPRFAWDGYAESAYFPTKEAGLRVEMSLRLDDNSYGTVNCTAGGAFIYERTGGPEPVREAGGQIWHTVPQPWAGNDTDTVRWSEYLLAVMELLIGGFIPTQIGLIVGPSPGSLRILPGRSTALKPKGAYQWRVVETGHTDDDATIVLSP